MLVSRVGFQSASKFGPSCSWIADTLIVWTEPQTQLDIALSFQDPDGCEDIWSFVCDVQRHLNNLPSESTSALARLKRLTILGDADPAASSPRLSMSPPLGSSVFQTRATWQAPSLANIKSVHLPEHFTCPLSSED